jgi:hypothetical protein
MRFEIKFTHSFRVTIGDWRMSMFVRPWLSIDFDRLGEVFPRGKAIINYIWMRAKVVGRWAVS